MSRTRSSCKVVTSFLALAAALSLATRVEAAGEDPCAALAAKHLYSPSPEGLLALAQCHEAHDKTATAWVEYLEAAQLAHRTKHGETETTAAKRASALAPHLAKLAVMVMPSADVDGIEVKRDGMVLDRAAWGTSAPVDPGEHVIEATAPGKQPWRRTVTIKAGVDSVTVGPMIDAVATTTVSSAPVAVVEPPVVAESPAKRGSAQRIAGVSLAVIGVGGLAAGGYFGLRALDHHDDATKACPRSPCSDRAGVDANDRAKNEAMVSTIALAAGGAALITGAILFLTAKKDAPAIGFDAAPGYAGLRFGGRLP